jgi:riboflavin kinase/FMN adenylyltransferase
MDHFHSFEEVHLQNSYVAIGSFDGVHLGHQAILKPLVEKAHAAGSSAVVVTFFPHPVAVLRNVDTPIYLSTPDERASWLGEIGIDVVLTLPFSREMAAWTAEEFMQKMCDHLGLRELWIGDDFALGRNRQGDIPTLTAMGAEKGYQVRVINEVTVLGARVSSSRIRELVRQGDVAQSAELLGRYYALCGPVVHGNARGRLLGFPTANVDYWPEKITPTYGVYATWTWIQAETGPRRVPSVTGVGVRPTFDPPDVRPRVEAYLIDFSGDLYGQQACVEFIEFLRHEMRFDTVQALIDQMNLDTLHAREVLAHAH